MIRIALLTLALVACSKKADEAKPAPAQTPPATIATTGSDGLRHIAVEANKEGYKPDRGDLGAAVGRGPVPGGARGHPARYRGA